MVYLPVLFRIQEIHNRQRILKKSITDSEQRPDLIEIRIKKAEYNKKLAAILKKQELTRKNQHQLDLELKSFLDKIRQEETKLYGGSVVNSRELEQIQLKVSEYTNSKSQIEERIFVLMEEEEKLAKLKEQFDKVELTCSQKLLIFEAEIKQKIFEFNLELFELESELSELMPLVSGEWLEKLEKIAHYHNGIGIAKIKSDCCGACHVSLSDALLQKAKRGDDQILLCENCGRIIFY